MDLQAHIEHLRRRLNRRAATWGQVASASGGELTASWVAKFAVGRMRNPTARSLIALESALDQCELAAPIGTTRPTPTEARAA